MEVDSQNKIVLTDPLVLGAAAFFVGFAVGVGRWNWVGREASRLAKSIGTLALNYASVAFEEKNPDLFEKKSTVMH